MIEQFIRLLSNRGPDTQKHGGSDEVAGRRDRIGACSTSTRSRVARKCRSLHQSSLRLETGEVQHLIQELAHSAGPFCGPGGLNQPCPPPALIQPSTCISGLTGLGLLGGTASQVCGPAIIRLDFSLFKDFRLSDRFRLQFRSEFFNILNHSTFNAPDFGGNGVIAIPGRTDFLNTAFGEIGSTRFPFNDPRQVQFALKLYY